MDVVLKASNIEKRKNVKLSFVNYLFFVIIEALWVYGCYIESENTMLASYVLACVYCTLTKKEKGIMLLLAFSIFENAFTFQGDVGWFYLLVIILAKCFFVGGKKLINGKIMVPFFFLISVATIGDVIQFGLSGKVFVTIVLLLFFFLLFSDLGSFSISPKDTLLFFGSSYIMMIWYVLMKYGGVSSYLSVFMGSYVYRFGFDFAVVTGGAMGIPIYSLLLIAISIVVLLNDNNSIVEKILCIFLIALSLAFGFLTISRSFVFGLLAIGMGLLFFSKKGETQIVKKIAIVCAVLIIGYLIVSFVPQINNVIIEQFTKRLVDDTSGGTGNRMEIFLESLSFLFKHPIALLFGMGPRGYQQYGTANNLLFSAGTHNFYIDLLMSFGVVGTLSVAVIIFAYFKKIGFFQSLKRNGSVIIPLLALIAFSLTALRTSSIKPVLYFYICFEIVSYYGKREVYDT